MMMEPIPEGSLQIAETVFTSLVVGIQNTLEKLGAVFDDGVVYCPKLWEGPKSSQEAVVFVLGTMLTLYAQKYDLGNR